MVWQPLIFSSAIWTDDHGLHAAIGEEDCHLRPDAEVIAHVEELGRKSDSGTLSDEECEEYLSLANAGIFISILKSKARQFIHKAQTLGTVRRHH
jgi:hypothetical protein